MAASHRTAEKPMKEILITLQMAHLLHGGDGLTGNARYPIDDWVKQGQPRITTSGWNKLHMKTCQKDYGNPRT
eukprot:3271924-Prorocentrum_lima.AAC.1